MYNCRSSVKVLFSQGSNSTVTNKSLAVINCKSKDLFFLYLASLFQLKETIGTRLD